MKSSITIYLMVLLTMCLLSGTKASSCLRFDISEEFNCPVHYMQLVRDRIANRVAQEAVNMDLINEEKELVVSTEQPDRRNLGAGRELNFCRFHGCGGLNNGFSPQYCWIMGCDRGGRRKLSEQTEISGWHRKLFWWIFYGPFAATEEECPRLEYAANVQLGFEKGWVSGECLKAIESITCECAE